MKFQHFQHEWVKELLDVLYIKQKKVDVCGCYMGLWETEEDCPHEKSIATSYQVGTWRWYNVETKIQL